MDLKTLTERKKIIWDKAGYAPNELQLQVHNCDSWLRMMVGGEGSGKSLVGAMELMGRFWEDKLFWLVGADYDNTTPEFNYIAEAADKLGVLQFASKVTNPGKIILTGDTVISTISAKDPRNISKYSPHGIVVCEAAQCDFEVIQRLIARLGRAGEGGWMLMTGTFEGSLGWYP